MMAETRTPHPSAPLLRSAAQHSSLEVRATAAQVTHVLSNCLSERNQLPTTDKWLLNADMTKYYEATIRTKRKRTGECLLYLVDQEDEDGDGTDE